MSTHTAGPWRVEPDVREYKGVKELTGWNVYAGERDEVVGCEGILSDGEANARLIASAPELLAMVQELKRHIAYGGDLHTSAEALIAKATGEAA